MQYCLPASSSNRDAWNVSHGILKIDDQGIQKLKALVGRVEEFLTKESQYYGHVSIYIGSTPASMDFYQYNEYLADRKYQRLPDDVDVEEAIKTSEGLDDESPKIFRVDCTQLKIMMGGTVYVTGLNHYSDDEVEVELPPDLSLLELAQP